MQNGGLRAAVFVCADVGVPPQPRASLPARGGWTRAIASGRVGNRRYILPTPRASRGPSPGGEVRRSAAPPHFRFRIKVFPAQKTPPTGGVPSKPQTPRAGRWREGGLAALPQYRTAISAETAVPLRLRESSEPVGPSDPRRPARHRTFSGAHRPNDSDATASRERWRLFEN